MVDTSELRPGEIRSRRSGPDPLIHPGVGDCDVFTTGLP